MKHIGYNLPIEDSIVIKKIEILRSAKLNGKCHLYEDYHIDNENISIGEAVKKEVNEKGYAVDAKQRPALALLRVILSINRNYNNFVRPRMIRLKGNIDLNSFEALKRVVNSMSKKDFFKYWNYEDNERYNILLDMLNAIDKLRESNKEENDDYKLINTWAKKVNITNLNNDIFGSIYNVSIATVQHLRMNFGIDTSKPDLQVVRVLEREFNIKTNKVKAINYVKTISEISGYKALELDQIFVNYGSGYYEPIKKYPQLEKRNFNIEKSKKNKQKNSHKNQKSTSIKSLIRKFESNIEKGKSYSLYEFYEIFKNHVKSGNNVFEMVEYLMDEVIKDKEKIGFNANFLRRNDDEEKSAIPSYIYELTRKDKGIGKSFKENAITIWLTGKSLQIDIRFINFKKTTYHTIDEMKNDDIVGKYKERLEKIT